MATRMSPTQRRASLLRNPHSLCTDLRLALQLMLNNSMLTDGIKVATVVAIVPDHRSLGQ